MKLINISGTINIYLSIDKTFSYLSDLRNDKEWRAEINDTIFLDNKIAVGHTVIENSFLSKKMPEYKSTLLSIECIPDCSIIYQTLPENPYYLWSNRRTFALNANYTKVTYQLLFDKRIVKHGLGFQ